VTVMASVTSLPLVKFMVLCVLGPLMVITQKVTSLAFSLHDGLARREDELSADQKYYVVR
jgi:lysophospholipid acyltransferase 1/2